MTPDSVDAAGSRRNSLRQRPERKLAGEDFVVLSSRAMCGGEEVDVQTVKPDVLVGG